MIVENLNIPCDSKKLWEDCSVIVSKYGWGNGQLCFTHRPEVTDPVDRLFQHVGSLRGSGFPERFFKVFNEELSGSYVEHIFKQLPFELGRFRLLRVKARSCYSVHVDVSKRIHIPLVTNDQALMVFPTEKEIVHLATDNVWLTDTTVLHTAMNGGTEDRYHLVASLAV